MLEDGIFVRSGDSMSPPDTAKTFGEMTLGQLSDILGSTIVCDEINKCILFLAMLTAYSKNDQLTICLLGQSSSGKTYLAQEISKYFPEEDVHQYASMSPTAFKYIEGVTEEDGKTYIDLERKILLFTEMPHPQLLENLRSVLSHDEHPEYVTTDVGSGGSRKARSAIIKGYPTVIFCSANTRMNEQEATRALLLSPETSTEKVKGATALTIMRRANPEKYDEMLKNDKSRAALKQRVEYIKSLNINSVIISDYKKVAQRFYDITKILAPRIQRDIGYVASLIKAVAMLNADSRMDVNRNVIANDSDIDEGFRLWEAIAETQGSGITPAVQEFYKNYVVPAYIEKKVSGQMSVDDDGVTLNDILSYCRAVEGRIPVNLFTIQKEFLPAMEESSLIVKGVYSRDHRVKLFKPLVLPEPRKVKPAEQIKEETSAPSNTPPQVVSPDSLDREEEELDLSNLDF